MKAMTEHGLKKVHLLAELVDGEEVYIAYKYWISNKHGWKYLLQRKCELTEAGK